MHLRLIQFPSALLGYRFGTQIWSSFSNQCVLGSLPSLPPLSLSPYFPHPPLSSLPPFLTPSLPLSSLSPLSPSLSPQGLSASEHNCTRQQWSVIRSGRPAIICTRYYQYIKILACVCVCVCVCQKWDVHRAGLD